MIKTNFITIRKVRGTEQPAKGGHRTIFSLPLSRAGLSSVSTRQWLWEDEFSPLENKREDQPSNWTPVEFYPSQLPARLLHQPPHGSKFHTLIRRGYYTMSFLFPFVGLGDSWLGEGEKREHSSAKHTLLCGTHSHKTGAIILPLRWISKEIVLSYCP